MRNRLLAAAIAGSARGAAPGCASRPSPTIHDAAFVRQANALCGKELPPLRAEKKHTDMFGSTPKDDRERTATRVEEVSDGLDKVAEHLGALPVKSIDDQAEVAAWLEEWANFTAVGRQYAAAVRTQKASVYTKIANDGNAPVGQIAKFARANRIDKCVL